MSNSLAAWFVQVCSLGEIEEFNEIFLSLSSAQKSEIIKFDHYACFHAAAANGQLEIINFIFKYFKLEAEIADEIIDEAVIPVFLDRKGEGFKTAIVNRHFETAERILTEEYLFSDCIDIIEEDSNFIKIVWDSPLRNCIKYIFSKCCCQDILAVQRILNIVPKTSHNLLLENTSNDLPITDRYYLVGISPFKMACGSGKLDILELLWSLYSVYYKREIIKDQFESSFIAAAMNGHWKFLRN